MPNQSFTFQKPVGQSAPIDQIKPPPTDPKIKLGTVNPPTEPQPDTSGWLTRNESADLLKMSVGTIANFERRGKLHPRRAYRQDSRGIEHQVRVYDPKELMGLRYQATREQLSREPGEIAARCFESFNEGKTIRDVVIEVRETPDRVRGLYEHWLDSGGAALTITQTAKEELEKTVGPFSSVADLLPLIAALKRE